MEDKVYKSLTDSDVEILVKNGCWASDWSSVTVADGFDARRVARVVFKGNVKIGSLAGEVVASDGFSRDCGIIGANLRDVTIGDGCFITGVHGLLANLNIEDGVLIENVGTIACTEESAFGNDTAIEVFNEGGGRDLQITSATSSQAAYITVMYRDNAELVAKMDELAAREAASLKSCVATIGTGSSIRNAGEIINVLVGAYARINGAVSLHNGTIDSSKESPTEVGSAVTAEKFIMQKSCAVNDGAMVCSSLIGEATKIGKQFSSENSVFFANSEGFHSEVCSMFGGPYSVTHHRTTLLIAGYASFYNAGSGTNQSNHMYKLGPLHQGIFERGCKTGSFSYLLWPSRVGAFTAVIGKHYANFDTSDFPFSYIDESGGKSTLVPGMNFFTVGTLRDGEKWPARDKRKMKDPLDLINFDVLSPYTAQKMLRGQDILKQLSADSKRGQEWVVYNGINIKRLLLKTCVRYYKLAMNKYMGDVLLRKLEETGEKIPEWLANLATADGTSDEWIDMSGMMCRKSRVDAVLASVISGEIASLSELQDALKAVYDVYRDDEWEWFIANFEKATGKSLKENTAEVLVECLDAWKVSSLKLLNMVMGDAGKEFDGVVRTGFGIDGNADADFDAVRGTMEDNKFVKKLKTDMEEVEKKHEALLALVK